MRCYLEVPMDTGDEERQDLCPTFCPALMGTGGGGANDPVGFYCNARSGTRCKELAVKLTHELVYPAGQGNPGWFEVKRREDCPLKKSATPVW